MRFLRLLLALCALTTSLFIPSNPQILTSPTSIQNTPWPPAPFRYALSTAYPLTMTIKRYGAPGPPNPDGPVLIKTLYEQLSARGGEDDKILNHSESTPGVSATFRRAGTGAGITRVQAEAVFRRIWGLTIVHGAIGIEKCEIEMAGKVVEKFELEYQFE